MLLFYYLFFHKPYWFFWIIVSILLILSLWYLFGCMFGWLFLRTYLVYYFVSIVFWNIIIGDDEKIRRVTWYWAFYWWTKFVRINYIGNFITFNYALILFCVYVCYLFLFLLFFCILIICILFIFLFGSLNRIGIIELIRLEWNKRIDNICNNVINTIRIISYTLSHIVEEYQRSKSINNKIKFIKDKIEYKK